MQGVAEEEEVRKGGEGEKGRESDGGERGIAEGGVEDGKGEGFGEEPAHGDHQAGILLVINYSSHSFFIIHSSRLLL